MFKSPFVVGKFLFCYELFLHRYNEEESDNEQEEDLLVPVVEATVKGEVTLVNGKPMVNGVPLGNLPKEERRYI